MSPASAAPARERTAPRPGGRRLAPAKAPRRVSGPAPRKRAAPAARAATRTAPVLDLAGLLPTRLLSLAGALSRHRLLDRLIRGRAWIALVAFALIGIVTLQLGLLQLNSQIGRALQSASALQRQNAALSVENSSLSAPERIEALATHDGMRSAPESALQFLGGSSAKALARAAAALSAPAGASSDAAASQTQQLAAATPPETAATATEAGAAGAGEAAGEAAPPASSEAPAEGSSESAGDAASPPGASTDTEPITSEDTTTGGAGGAAAEQPTTGAG